MSSGSPNPTQTPIRDGFDLDLTLSLEEIAAAQGLVDAADQARDAATAAMDALAMKTKTDSNKSNVLSWKDTESGDAAKSVLVPIQGGIMKITDSAGKNDIFAFSGDDPDLSLNIFSWNQKEGNEGDWEIESSKYTAGHQAMKGPPHDGMYRPTGIKHERATRLACCSYKGTVLFNGLNPPDGKMAMKPKLFIEALRIHLIHHGMHNVFRCEDATTGKDIDSVRFYSKVTKLQMAAHVAKLVATGCPYIRLNLVFSGVYLRATISPELLGKLLREVAIDASGPESFNALMRIVHSDSYAAMQLIIQRLRDVKLSSYKGENVEACCDDILTMCEQLDAAGAFVPDLLCNIIQVFEGTKDQRLMTWAMSRYEVVALRVKELHATQSPVEIGDPEHYVNLCADVTSQYRAQVDAKRWTVTGGQAQTDEPTLPAGYKAAGCLEAPVTMAQFQAFAATMSANLLKQVEFKTRNDNGAHKTNNGACHNCGKQGHLARACPNASTGKGTDRPDWKNKLNDGEDPATATRTMNGRVYKWCATCGFFIFHHQDGHVAWAARRAAEGRTVPTNATSTGGAAALLAGGLSMEDMEEDFTNSFFS